MSTVEPGHVKASAREDPCCLLLGTRQNIGWDLGIVVDGNSDLRIRFRSRMGRLNLPECRSLILQVTKLEYQGSRPRDLIFPCRERRVRDGERRRHVEAELQIAALGMGC